MLKKLPKAVFSRAILQLDRVHRASVDALAAHSCAGPTGPDILRRVREMENPSIAAMAGLVELTNIICDAVKPIVKSATSCLCKSASKDVCVSVSISACNVQ